MQLACRVTMFLVSHPFSLACTQRQQGESSIRFGRGEEIWVRLGRHRIWYPNLTSISSNP